MNRKVTHTTGIFKGFTNTGTKKVSTGIWSFLKASIWIRIRPDPERLFKVLNNLIYVPQVPVCTRIKICLHQQSPSFLDPSRVSTEINFVGISIGIPIEISFDF
jgi:hypothetical protein